MKKRKTAKHNIPKKIAKTLDIPEDILFDIPRITMMSNRELRIENYKSILEYESDKISLSAKEMMIELHGADLDITIITDEEICITGYIVSIEFSKLRS
ncbi:MAG: YabP/YqfC family sporulation protein [Clostridia bacterium]|nr:YabP/YqfC family sporulation protein [Clostridia bacterium]